MLEGFANRTAQRHLIDGLNGVCDYPEGEIHLSMDDWIDRNFDYFEFLEPEMRNASLQLQGPCYPVIFPSVNCQ